MAKLKRQQVAPVNGPRTHSNCEFQTGVSRPGKTATDKANGSWKSKQERNAAHEKRREALNTRRK